MVINLESALPRWTSAGLITEEQAHQLNAFESANTPAQQSHSHRVAIATGLVFGGLMLAAGVLLFISAHWDELSPAQRMAILLATVSSLHALAAICAARFPSTATAFHAVGTIAAGGAIFLAGQIFHMQEHWPTGLFLWSLAALAGWLLRRDWPQLTLLAVLAPAWLVSGWLDVASHSQATLGLAAWGCFLLLFTYLSVPANREASIRTPLHWFGRLGLLPAVLIAILFSFSQNGNSAATFLDLIGWPVALAVPLTLACCFRHQGVWLNGLAAFWVVACELFLQAQSHTAVYAWCAIGAAGLIAWGTSERRADGINLGMAAFALTVLLFYFSNVMGQLGRSASLITLGLLFLGGGGYGEQFRRKLVAQMETNTGGLPQ